MKWINFTDFFFISRALCESKEEVEKQETSSNLETPPNSEDNQKPNDQEQVQVEAEVKEEEIITDETKDDALAVAAAVQAVSEEVPEKKEDDIYENPLLVDVSSTVG